MSDSPKPKRKKKSADSIYRPSEDSKVPSKPKPRGHPKRPSNAYFLYVKKNRAAMKEENPSLSFGQLGKKMAEDFKNLSVKEKKPYKEEAEKEKNAYQEAMVKYKKSQKYKKYLRDLEEWNEIYRDEWEQQEEEKKEKRESDKKKRKEKEKKKKNKKKKRSDEKEE